MLCGKGILVCVHIFAHSILGVEFVIKGFDLAVRFRVVFVLKGFDLASRIKTRHPPPKS